MRELSHSIDYPSPSMNSSGMTSRSGETTRQNSFASFSASSSPSKEQQQQHGLMMDLGNKLSKLPGLSSPARTSQSTDYSTWDKEASAMYCSSAGYSSTQEAHNKRSSPHSLQEIVLSSDSNQRGGGAGDHTDSSALAQKKSKSKEGKFLPDLKPATSNNSLNSSSPPKMLFKRNPSVHPSMSMGFSEAMDEAVDPRGIAYDHGSSSGENNQMGSTSGDSIEGPDIYGNCRAMPGDHWLVDEGDLPAALVVHIPITNPWLGILSPECVEMLGGLFEVRPSHRWGCRNLNKIHYSAWLENFKLTDWETLGQKKYTPRFQPGKRFIKDTLTRLEDISQARLLGTTTHEGGAAGDEEGGNELISAEQEEEFKDFYYVSRVFGGSMTNESAKPYSQHPQAEMTAPAVNHPVKKAQQEMGATIKPSPRPFRL